MEKRTFSFSDDFFVYEEGQKTFEQYQVLEELGQGGMGKVYRVRDLKIKRIVALKVLIPRSEHDHKVIQRFLLEARVTAGLNHPNIVKLYRIGFSQGYHFYTMELIEGKTLFDYIGTSKIRFSKITQIIEKIAMATHYAHEQGVVHRDLKSSNILLDNQLVPYIVDFGLAKVMTESSLLTQSHEILGTPFYMSPEQAKGQHKQTDAQSDIYSLGVILYELITKELPFTGTSMPEILTKIVEGTPTSPSTINPQISKHLENICLKAMAKKKEQRYSTAAQLAEDVKNFQQKNFKQIIARPVRKFSKWHLALILVVITLLLSGVFAKKKNLTYTTPIATKKIKVSATKKLFTHAQAFLTIGFYQQAHNVLQKALDSFKPGDISKEQLLGKLILAHAGLKNYTTVLKIYLQLSNTEKKRPEVILATAKAYYHTFKDLKDIKKAENLLKKIFSLAKIPPKIQKEAFYYQALALFNRKDFTAALDFFNKSQQIKAKLNFPMLSFYKGTCCFHTKQFAQGKKFLMEASKKLPDLALVHEYLGKCFFALTQFNKAKKSFEKCLKLQPGQSKYHTLYAKVLVCLKQYQKANDSYLKSLQLNSKNIEALQGLIETALYNTSTRHSLLQLVMHYLRFIHLEIPDLFYFDIKRIQRTYRNNYIQWQSLTKRKALYPKIFFQKLQNFRAQEIYRNAISGLTALRYHPQFDTWFQKALADFKNQKHIKNVWTFIQEQKKQEQKLLAYYRCAYFYLEKDIKIQKELRSSDSQKNLLQILENSKEKPLIRYLAAYVLFHLGKFFPLEQGTKSKDHIKACICICVLRQGGLFCQDGLLEKLTLELKDPFLLSMIAKSVGPNRYTTLLRLLQKKHLKVKLQAAAQITNTRKANKKEVKDVEQVFIGAIKHSQPYIRQFVHSHFWKLPTAQNFPNLFFQGLEDPSFKVQIPLLYYFAFISLDPAFSKVAKIVENSDNVLLRFMATNAVCLKNPYAPIIKQIINNRKNSALLRLYALTRAIFKKLLTGKLDTSIAKNLPTFAKDSDPVFRVSIFYLSALMGNQPVKYFSNEKHNGVRANILLNLRIKSVLPMLLSVGRYSRLQKWRMAKKYLSHADPRIRKAAHMAYTFLAKEQQRQKWANEILADSDLANREGCAMGFYNLVQIDVMGNKESAGMIKDNVRSPQEHYDIYITSLEESSRIPQNAQKHLKWLGNAISLADMAKYRYERAIVYFVNNKLNYALKDLQKALELRPYTPRYMLLKAIIFSLHKQTANTLKMLDKITKLSQHESILFTCATLFNRLEKFDKAIEILKLLLIKQPYEIQHRLMLIQTYLLHHQKRQAQQHWKYLKAFYNDKHQKHFRKAYPKFRELEIKFGK